MKKLYNPYIPVAILTIVACYTIGSVGLDNLPMIGKCENAERFNSVLLNLSYSFLASVMFFIMIDILPRWRNQKKAKIIFKEPLKDVMRYMDHVIAILKMMAGTSKSDDDITPNDFNALEKLSPILRSAYVEYTIGNKSDKEQGAIDCYAYLEYYSKSIRNRAQQILELPASTIMRQELTTLLVEIKLSEVLSICSNGFKHLSNSSTDIYAHDLNKHAYPFFRLYKELGRYVELQYPYHFSFVDENEKEELQSKLINLVNVINANGANMVGTAEVHFNRTFLCFYALPEQFQTKPIMSKQ